MDVCTRLLCLVIFLVKVFTVISSAGTKPPEMAQGIYCECCSALVKELTKKLEKKSSDPWELKVVEAMEDICTVENFRAYTYSPPTTIKACKYIMDKFDEEIESVLIKKDSDPEKSICYEVTKACEGVDRTKKEKEDMDVRINDKKQEVKQPDDGIQRMNVDINDPNSAKNLAEQIKQQIAQQQAMGGGGGDDDDDEVDDEPDADDDGDEGNERSVKKEPKEKEPKTEL